LVADGRNDRIQIFDKDGNFIHKFGKKGDEPGELTEPTGIVLNSKKEIIVAQYQKNHLQVFDYQGYHLRFIGMGRFSNSGHLCLDEQENIYIGNWKSEYDSDISVFSGINGDLLHVFGRGALSTPVGIAYHQQLQRILVGNDSKTHTVCMF